MDRRTSRKSKNTPRYSDFRFLEPFLLLGVNCSYRGHLTAPLDQRWQRGGWTSHFQWKHGGDFAHLDVFGVAPRATSSWESETRGLLASMHTVAEMKRTDRAKDWPFADSLGVKLIEAADLRGWLHIHNVEVLMDLKKRVPLPSDIVAQRPVLNLVVNDDSRLKSAVFAETVYWQQLDKIRLEIHDAAVRPYFRAVKKDTRLATADFNAQHEIRVQCAEKLLPCCPILDYGIDQMIVQARQATSELVVSSALEWLPDVHRNFVGLER